MLELCFYHLFQCTTKLWLFGIKYLNTHNFGKTTIIRQKLSKFYDRINEEIQV